MPQNDMLRYRDNTGPSGTRRRHHAPPVAQPSVDIRQILCPRGHARWNDASTRTAFTCAPSSAALAGFVPASTACNALFNRSVACWF